jgi:hypothetical protein
MPAAQPAAALGGPVLPYLPPGELTGADEAGQRTGQSRQDLAELARRP